MKKVKRFVFRIKRLVKWLPVIWDNVWWDWDSEVLYKLMIPKLKEMEYAFSSKGAMTESAKVKAKEIRAFRLALERIINQTYFDAFDNLTRENLLEIARLENLDIEFCGKMFAQSFKWSD